MNKGNIQWTRKVDQFTKINKLTEEVKKALKEIKEWIVLDQWK